jgi:hypothetical protein
MVVSAIGPRHQALYGKVAPTFERYAAKHHWDLKVMSELPDWFVQEFSRPGWDFRSLCCAYKLQQPSQFPAYDLMAIMDQDMIINPNAPCLSSYYDQIPPKGIAAVQDVSFSERRLFPEWNRYHYSDFLKDCEVEKLPFPELHVNSGLMLVKPSEVKDEMSELNRADSALSDEDRVNLTFTQTGRVLMLPSKWNVVYPYELVRRGYDRKRSSHPKFLTPKRLQYEWDTRFTHQRLIHEIFRDVYVLHFASTDKNVLMHLDAGKLLSVA